MGARHQYINLVVLGGRVVELEELGEAKGGGHKVRGCLVNDHPEQPYLNLKVPVIGIGRHAVMLRELHFTQEPATVEGMLAQHRGGPVEIFITHVRGAA